MSADRWVLVRESVVDFLRGAAPMDGLWFGERHPDKRGAFWWREALAAAPAAPAAEPFVVRHYIGDERPCIKGNGFDGLEVGEDRDEAEAFVRWVNARIGSAPEAAPAAPEPHIDGWPLYSGLPPAAPLTDIHGIVAGSAPAAPAAEPVCRSDGRCQYAIDSGAEGLGHCPKGKCIMPAAPGATPAQSREPLTDHVAQALAEAHSRPAMQWPADKEAGRAEDMGEGYLRLVLDHDNDVCVSVWDGQRSATVEFCNPGGGGGGRSSRTRMALIALMVAMEADNAERPDLQRPRSAHGIGSQP